MAELGADYITPYLYECLVHFDYFLGTACVTDVFIRPFIVFSHFRQRLQSKSMSYFTFVISKRMMYALSGTSYYF